MHLNGLIVIGALEIWWWWYHCVKIHNGGFTSIDENVWISVIFVIMVMMIFARSASAVTPSKKVQLTVVSKLEFLLNFTLVSKL